MLEKILNMLLTVTHVRGALHDLVPFVQFKKRENTHGGMLLLVVG